MPLIALISPRPDALADFAAELEAHSDVELVWARTKEEALDLATRLAPALMIIDGDPPDLDGIELVRSILTVNAMINMALVSDLPEVEFHDVTEGLGLLARLSPRLGRDEATDLHRRLLSVIGPSV